MKTAALEREMSDIYLNMYRVSAAIVVVALFFFTGRPYFSTRMRLFACALTAGVLNAFAGGALLQAPLSSIPLRFLIAFVGIGAGVALLEYLFPEGGRRISLRLPRLEKRSGNSQDENRRPSTEAGSKLA